jgi:hypothetical protein
MNATKLCDRCGFPAENTPPMFGNVPDGEGGLRESEVVICLECQELLLNNRLAFWDERYGWKGQKK